MRLNWRALALAFTAAGLLMAQGATAQAGCVGLLGTADGANKQTAVARAQNALAGAIRDYKAQKRIRSVSINPMRGKPQPYWRDSVSANLYQRPDVVTRRSHTICWSGVISPSVCTSGARVCW